MPDSTPSLRLASGRRNGPAPKRFAHVPRSPLSPAIGWGLALLFLATAGRAAIFTVGTSGGCTHSNLQAALDAAAANGTGYDEIRLSQDQVGNFSIAGHSVGIIGGYSNCAATTPSGNTLVSASGSGRVVDISGGASTVRNVDLVHLQISDGSTDYGAGLYIELKALVTLEDTVVSGNVAALSGGGIYVKADAGAVLTLDQGSAVMGNLASNAVNGKGGGISCSIWPAPVPSPVIGLLDAFIYDNEAATDGGGLYLYGCGLTSYSGGAVRGIVGNRAKRGGGVFAEGGSQVRFFGGNEHPALISGNSSTAPNLYPGWPYGGAVRIEGAGTRLELHDSWVLENHGDRAIAARDADSVVMDRTLGAGCHDPVRCSLFAGNTGGGIEIENTSLTLKDTFLEENGPSPVVSLSAGSRPALIEGAVFARNHFDCPTCTRSRIISVSSGQVRIAYSTFVDNLTDVAMWTPQYALGLDYLDGASHDLAFVGNLVAETGGELVDTYDNPAMWNNYNETFDCLIVHEGSMLPPVSSATQILPGSSLYFVDRAGHDYHLRAGSAPIDICDTLNFSPGLDIDLQPRGYDDATLPNWYGPFDLGADERSGLSPLFADGFELGNSSRWSATVP